MSLTPAEQIHSAMGAKWGNLIANYTFNHVRASLTSSTGAFFVTNVTNVRVVGKNPLKRRVVTARVTLVRAPDYKRSEAVNYRMIYNGKTYKATLGNAVP